MLRALGWDVATARDLKVEAEPDDYLVLRKAREDGRVLLTFDVYRGLAGTNVQRELKTKGGKLIIVAGGPEQPPDRAVGKLLFHREKWLPFLVKGDGRVYIGDIKPDRCRLVARRDIHVQVRAVGQPNFGGYLDEVERRKTAPRAVAVRRPKLDLQTEMDLQEGDDTT